MTAVHSAFSTFGSHERGILTANDYKPLTLHGCAIDVEVKGCGAKVRLQLEYINESNKDQRVIAAYPLPLGWNLCQCRLQYDGDEVRSTYTKSAVHMSSESASAVSAGASADRLVWTVASQDVPYVVSVGMSIVMSATYEMQLPSTHTSGAFLLELPAQLVPYTKRPHTASLEYNMLFQVQTTRLLRSGLSLRVDGQLFFPLRGVVKLTQGGDTVYANAHPTELPCEVTYTGDSSFSLVYNASLDTCVRGSLAVACEALNTVEPLRLFMEQDVGTFVPDCMQSAVLTYLTPNIASCDVNAEYVFIIDSHSSETSKAVGRAFYLALRALPASVRVNAIILTDDKPMCVFTDKSMPVKELPLMQLASLVAEVTPQRPTCGDGYSRLPAAVHAALTSTGVYSAGPAPSGYCRQVVVISDEAGSTDLKGTSSMIAEAIGACSHARVSTIAVDIGHSASGLVALNLLALQGGGVYEQVDVSSELPEALVQVLAATAVPTLTGVMVHFNEEGVRSAVGKRPQPVLPNGSQRMLYALAPTGIQTISASVSGRVGSMVVEYMGSCEAATQVELQCEQTEDNPECITTGIIHLNAASARMRYLMESNDQAAPTAEQVQEAVLLSQVFGIASPYTQLTQCRVGAPAPPPCSGTVIHVAAKYMPRARTFGAVLVERTASVVARQALLPNRARLSALAPTLPPAAAPVKDFLRAVVLSVVDLVVADPDVDRLVPLQRSDGAFPAGQVLSRCLGMASGTLAGSMPASCPSPDVWATVVAVAAMQIKQSRLTTLAERAAVHYLVGAHRTEWRDWLEVAHDVLVGGSA